MSSQTVKARQRYAMARLSGLCNNPAFAVKVKDRYPSSLMKPKDLKRALNRGDCSAIIQDFILHMPRVVAQDKNFSFPCWQQLFGNNNPVIMEFCSGHGHWIVEQARRSPQINWVAIEMKFSRVRQIWSKRENEKLNNLFIVSGEGSAFVHHYLQEEAAAQLYINFPDPWPKRRHHKHRLINPSFTEQLVRILKRGGRLHFATDDRNYLEWTLRLFTEQPKLFPIHPTPHYISDSSAVSGSYFETMWRQMGKEIYYTQFERV